MDEETVEIPLRLPATLATPATLLEFADSLGPAFGFVTACDWIAAFRRLVCYNCAGVGKVGKNEHICPECDGTGWRDGQNPVAGEPVNTRHCGTCGHGHHPIYGGWAGPPCGHESCQTMNGYPDWVPREPQPREPEPEKPEVPLFDQWGPGAIVRGSVFADGEATVVVRTPKGIAYIWHSEPGIVFFRTNDELKRWSLVRAAPEVEDQECYNCADREERRWTGLCKSCVIQRTNWRPRKVEE